MATFPAQKAVAFGTQSAEGTADPTIAALSGSLNLANGIVRGDANVGDDKSGIEIQFDRVEAEGGFASGGYTALDGAFIRRDVTFSFTFQLCGNRLTTTGAPADSEFEQQPGIKAIFRSIGLTGAGSGTPGFIYTPINAGFVTVKIFDSGKYTVLKDVKCATATFDLTPAGVPTIKCDFSAKVDSGGLVTFPTLDYEEQDTVNAPSVVAVAPSWGLSDEVRGWESLSIAISNEINSTPDSASTTGESFTQDGRTVTVSMKIKDTDTDIDHTISNLIGTAAPTEHLKALIGTTNAGTEPALATRLQVGNLRVKSYKPVGSGVSYSEITAQATGLTNGSEFLMFFE